MDTTPQVQKNLCRINFCLQEIKDLIEPGIFTEIKKCVLMLKLYSLEKCTLDMLKDLQIVLNTLIKLLDSIKVERAVGIIDFIKLYIAEIVGEINKNVKKI